MKVQSPEKLVAALLGSLRSRTSIELEELTVARLAESGLTTFPA